VRTRSGRRQALDQAIEQRLGLGVDPVEILETSREAGLALAEQEPLDRLVGVRRRCRRIEGLPVASSTGRRAARGAPAERPQRLVEREELARHLLADLPGVVARVDLDVGLEQIDAPEIAVAFP
jgi:hypothetical protein